MLHALRARPLPSPAGGTGRRAGWPLAQSANGTQQEPQTRWGWEDTAISRRPTRERGGGKGGEGGSFGGWQPDRDSFTAGGRGAGAGDAGGRGGKRREMARPGGGAKIERERNRVRAPEQERDRAWKVLEQ